MKKWFAIISSWILVVNLWSIKPTYLPPPSYLLHPFTFYISTDFLPHNFPFPISLHLIIYTNHPAPYPIKSASITITIIIAYPFPTPSTISIPPNSTLHCARCLSPFVSFSHLNLSIVSRAPLDSFEHPVRRRTAALSGSLYLVALFRSLCWRASLDCFRRDRVLPVPFDFPPSTFRFSRSPDSPGYSRPRVFVHTRRVPYREHTIPASGDTSETYARIASNSLKSSLCDRPSNNRRPVLPCIRNETVARGVDNWFWRARRSTRPGNLDFSGHSVESDRVLSRGQEFVTRKEIDDWWVSFINSVWYKWLVNDCVFCSWNFWQSYYYLYHLLLLVRMKSIKCGQVVLLVASRWYYLPIGKMWECMNSTNVLAAANFEKWFIS